MITNNHLPNQILNILQLSFPLIQAGMGGISMPELAASVANEGCGGTIALYKYQPDEVRLLINRTKQLTSKPFGVNIIPEILKNAHLTEQVKVAIDSGRKGMFFLFYGIPSEDVVKEIKKNKYPILIQIGTLKEAEICKSYHIEAIIVQGIEAGGHHLGKEYLADIFRRVKRYVPDIPVLVSGGIASGKDLAQYVKIGADGGLCGTLFAASEESAAHALYKQMIVNSNPDDTSITDVFNIGWPNRDHRVIKNIVVNQGRKLEKNFIAKNEYFGKFYPVPRFSASAPTVNTTGEIMEMAMYCGLSCEKIKDILPTRDIISNFISEYKEALSNLNY